MKKNYNIITDVSVIKKVVIFIEVLILFLVISSSVAVAYTGFSEENKSSHIHKNTVNQTEFSPKFGLSPRNPKFTEYQNDLKFNKLASTLTKHKYGHIPSPIDFSNLKHTTIADVSASTSTSITPSYDLRSLNRVTPVKDQDPTSTCWTFATYGSLESYLMPEQQYNFSEQNMKNLLSANYTDGFDRTADSGGDAVRSTAYLTRWSGPINNSDDLWNPMSVVSPLGLPIQKHVQNVTFLPTRNDSMDNLYLKKAIMIYGGMDVGMYFDDANYSSNTYGYYYNGNSNANHAVVMVGWDDSYNASNFTTKPPGDGAFIIKNSWGPSWGDNGYFYVSYYDKIIGYDENVLFTAGPLNDYTNIYQYDPLGWTAKINTSQTNPTTGWAANIFTAKSNEALKAVSFYTTDINCNYVINIYNNTGSTPISQAGPALTQSGTIQSSGYHTVPLNSGVQLNGGQNFSVVLELTNPTSEYPIAVEMPISDYSSHATANASESFASPDGTTWTDITTEPGYSNTNVCIKAFTDPVRTPTITWSNPANISYGTALSDIQLDASATNTVTGDPVAGTFVYTPPSGTVLSVGTWTLNVSFTPTDTANYTTASKNVLINVMGMPSAHFRINQTQGTAPLDVQFTDKSTGLPTAWYWVFGDGTTSNLQNPEHIYTVPGTYSPELTAYNITGISTKISTVPIIVTAPVQPDAHFRINATTGPATLDVQFTDKSTGSPTEWYWVFRDGTTSNLQNPEHIYNTEGIYRPELTASNDYDTSTKISTVPIIVTAPVQPDAHFRINATTGPVPLDVQFTDKTTGSPAEWYWVFGDGTTSNLQNPEHIYTQAGTYTPILAASNNYGTSTKTSTVPIAAT